MKKELSGLIALVLASAIIFFTGVKSAENNRPKGFPVMVVSITDGDTIKVLFENRTEKVRLIGIDTPESRKNKRAEWQARDLNKNINEIIKLGKKAKKFVQSLVKKGDIVYLELDVQQKDKYGRILAYVWLKNGKMLNKEIICNGYAMLLTIPPNVKYAEEFKKCFNEARMKRKGLWK